MEDKTFKQKMDTYTNAHMTFPEVFKQIKGFAETAVSHGVIPFDAFMTGIAHMTKYVRDNPPPDDLEELVLSVVGYMNTALGQLINEAMTQKPQDFFESVRQTALKLMDKELGFTQGYGYEREGECTCIKYSKKETSQ